MPPARAPHDEPDDLAELLARCERARSEGDVKLLAELGIDGARRARDAGDDHLAGRFDTMAAYGLWRLDRAEEARDRALGAIADIDAGSGPDWQIDVRHTIAMTYGALSAPGDGLPYAHAALRLARHHRDELGSGAISWSLNRLATLIDGLGDTSRAVELLQKASDLAGDDDDARFAATFNLAVLARLAADRARVEGDRERQRETARTGLAAIGIAHTLTGGRNYHRLVCTEQEAGLRLLLDEPDRSLAAVAEHRRLNEGLALPAERVAITLIEIRALVELGRVDEARRLSETDLDEVEFHEDDVQVVHVLEAKMLVKRALGEFEEALDLSEQLRARERRTVRERVEAQLRVLLRDAEIETARFENDRLREHAESLEQRADQATEAAMTDPLTGLANRRALEHHFASWKADGRPDLVAIALLDVDYFKRVNDAFGHDTGDAVLRTLAGLLTAGTRVGDLVVRSGGEEFVLVLTGRTLPEAVDACSELRRRISEHPWRDQFPGVSGVTASLGVTIGDDDDEPSDMLRRADLAMYRAKRDGRDRVEVILRDEELGAPAR